MSLCVNLMFNLFFRQEWHQLLISVKSTVEGLLASQSVNVWNTYGGLERLSKNIQHILSHDLKVPQVCHLSYFNSLIDPGQ